MKKIKISRSKWAQMGREAGWMDDDQMQDGGDNSKMQDGGDNSKMTRSPFAKMYSNLFGRKWVAYMTDSPDGSRIVELGFDDGSTLKISGSTNGTDGTWSFQDVG